MVNLYRERLMDKPSIRFRVWCPICGKPATAYDPLTGHHIVPRADGGHSGPTIYLCGHGTAGCHGKAEDKRLHFDWNDAIGWWVWLETPVPTKYELALDMEGWRKLNAA